MSEKNKATWPEHLVAEVNASKMLALLRSTNPAPSGATMTRQVACGGTLTYCGHPQCEDKTIKWSHPSPPQWPMSENKK